MSSAAAARRAAVSVSNAQAEASRRNGAKSHGPKTLEGKARCARNAVKHGMRAQKYLVLPEEDAAEFAGLEAALIEELAPVGARLSMRRWRSPLGARRADRARPAGRGRRLAARAGRPHRGRAVRGAARRGRRARARPAPRSSGLTRGSGTRSFETLLRYRAAALAEFWRALRTLKALQAEAAEPLERAAGVLALEAGDGSAVAGVPMAASPATKRTGTTRDSVRDGRMGNDRARAAAHLA
jgi:hypothetical protein